MASIGMANNYVSGAETISVEVILSMDNRRNVSVKLTGYSCELAMVDVVQQ